MYSVQFLLTVLGLGVLALICSIMPVSPTPMSSILILIGAVAGLFLPAIFTIIFAGGILGIFILDAILGHVQVKVIRVFPKQIYRGIPAEYALSTKENDSKKSFNVSSLVKVIARQPMCSEIKLTKKQGKTFFKGSLVGLRRGRYQVPPYALRIYGPLGLSVWHRPSNVQSTIDVLPDLPAAQRIATSIAQGRFGAAGIKRRGPLGLGTNFESIREYFPDDDMRHVNWAATNRVGYPMTNQFRVEQDRDVICLLDTGRLMMAPLTQKIETHTFSLEDENEEADINYKTQEEELNVELGATRLDVAIDALCAISTVSEVLGDRIGVISFDSQIRKHLKPRRSGSDSVISTIYDAEPIPVDSDFESAFSRIGKAKRSFVIIFTDFLDPNSAGPLIRSLPSIIKKHKVVVASIIDNDVETIIKKTTNSSDIAAHYLSFNAQKMREAALEVVTLVEKAGAQVVYVNQDDLSIECVKRYLEAKQRERI